MKDSMDLILRLFEGIDLAAEEHRAVDSARAVLPHQKRYNLWTIGNSNLDSRLVGNPAVRARVVSILTNLVSVLSPGIQFSRSQNQQDLHQDVQRVFEQASTIADVHPNQPARRSPINIIDFLDATNIEIKSRVDNLYELSPTLARPFENYDETEPRHVEEVELPKRRSLAVDSPLLENQRLPCQSIDQLRPSVVPASDSSTTSQDSPRTDASSSNSCTTHSSSRTDSTSIRSLFSKSAIPDSRQSPTDTSMSTLPLQAKQSHSELTVSTSKRASSSSSSSSSSYKDCEASFGDPPEVE